LINSRAAERSTQHLRSVDRIETEVAAKLLRCLFPAIRSVYLRPFRESYRLGLPYQRADQAVDEGDWGVRCDFFMVRILQLADVSGILYQSMLEPASGANKGSPLLTGKANPA